MTQGTLYDLATGRLGAQFEMTGEPSPQEGFGWISGHWDEALYHVVDGCPVRRPDMAITVNGAAFSGLPNPATVRVGEEVFEVTDGTAELTFMVPGPYRVEITAFPFQDAAFEVTAP